jgi:hypothetical protein
MLWCMRTTIRVRDELLRRARKRAAEEDRTLTSLVEEGLALVLALPGKRRSERVNIPVSRSSGGLLPGVDLSRAADLEAAMEEP